MKANAGWVFSRSNRGRRPLELLCFGVGTAVYLASFLLPAVRSTSERMLGLQCALAPLVCHWMPDSFFNILLIQAGGMINPLALAYVCLRTFSRGENLRRGLAVMGLAFIPLAWTYLAVKGYQVEIGHVAWVAGLLLMMGPEAIRGTR